MELHQLRYFCAIAETGSFSRAALKTNISQPSLSQQIRKLEDELGVKLFDRLGRSVRLTEFGQSFLPRARAVLHDLEMARSEVAEKTTTASGPICIGVIPTVGPYLLPDVLRSFSREWPQARISVVEEITPRLLEKVREGSIDIAIIALPLQVHGHEFDSQPLLTEKLFAVVPRKHPLAQRSSISLRELETDPFLLLRDGHCFRATTVAACNRARVHPTVVFESGQFSSILSMVSAGLGVSVVPKMAVEKRAGCRFLSLDDAHAARTLGAVTLRGKTQSRLTKAFLAQVCPTNYGER
jgi:LysR family transcriptional regulator, hydrogen peroxide-inducible genes activator